MSDIFELELLVKEKGKEGEIPDSDLPESDEPSVYKKLDYILRQQGILSQLEQGTRKVTFAVPIELPTKQLK
jgi:hypothetical protein